MIQLHEIRIQFKGEKETEIQLQFRQDNRLFELKRVYQHSDLTEISAHAIEIRDRLARFFESDKLEIL